MSELFHKVKCKLCPKTFEAPPMKIPEAVNEPVDMKTALFVHKLAEHTAKKHAGEFSAIMVLSHGIIGSQVLSTFDIQDAGIQKRMENLRHQMFRMFQSRTLLDEELQEMVSKAGFDVDAEPELVEIIFNLLRGIRDYLTEREQPSATPVPAMPLVTQ